MMDNSAANRSEQMEHVLREKITLLHEHLASLEQVLDQYRQMRTSLLESETRFHLMINNITDYAIFMLDTEGYITTWNIGAAQIKGYQAEEIIGRHFSIFYTTDDQERGKPARGLEVARREGRFLDENWRVRKDGSQFWASVVITAISDQTGQLLGFGKVTRDLTERKRMEDALTRQYEAQEAIRQRNAFLSVAAHELKTPITTLQGFAQVSLRHIEKANVLDPARVVRAFQMINIQANKLAQLVKQLLDIGWLESGQSRLTTSRIDITELAQQTIALIETQTTQHTFVLQTPPSVIIEADTLRLEQVLINVLDNAVKFSPHGSQIVVAIDEFNTSQIQIRISDAGIGIPDEERERIFEPFYRVYSDMVPAATSGTGLGLFVSRQIVAMHQGQMAVEATLGGGSCFVITLPVHAHATVQQTGESRP